MSVVRYKEKVGVIGLGKLGLPMFACFLSRGFDVYGYDSNSEYLTSVKSKNFVIKEPGISEVMAEYETTWSERFFENLECLIKKVDLIFIIVPTPTNSKGIFDLEIIESVLLEVAYLANDINKNLTCVITSTVNPGDCENLLKSINTISKNKIELVYSPEFIALGSVMRDMLHPDIVLLGGKDDGINTVFSIYSRLYKSYPEYHRLNYIEAEIAKIAVNTYVTTKISFANMIGMYTEKMGGRANCVLRAIGGDSRVGRKYFKFGASYGGPCFPRDNLALSKHIESLGFRPEIPQATDSINSQVIDYWFNKIIAFEPSAVVLNGLAYKQGTNFLEESFMVKLGLRLIDCNVKVFFSDPLVVQHDKFLFIDAMFKQTKKTSRVLILQNYGDIDQRLLSLEQVEVIDLWQ